MSFPGYSQNDWGDNPQGLTQDQMRQMMMARMLMQQPSAGGGLAGAGQQIGNALAMKNLMNMSDPQNQTMQQRYGMNAGQANNILHPSMMNRIGSMFGMGGS